MEDKKLISIESGLWETRLIILFETGPQSCRYRQVLLNQENFKTFSDLIKSMMKQCTDPKHGHGDIKECFLTIVEDKFDVMIKNEIQSFYPKEFAEAH